MATQWEGGAREVLPLRKGGGGMLKGGGSTQTFGVVFTQKLEVLAILKGGHKKFPLFKRGGAILYLTCLSHYVAPPLPVINDQSLSRHQEFM